MNVEETRAFVRETYQEMFRNPDIIDKAFASNYVGYDPASPETIRGTAALKQQISMYADAFPDLRFVVEDVVVEGEKAVARWRASGTHQGELMGVSPTGKSVEVTGTSYCHLSGGKIDEEYTNWDALGMMRQLGAVELPSGAAK